MMNQLPVEILNEYDENWQLLDMLDWLQGTTNFLEIPSHLGIDSNNEKNDV